MKTLIETAVGHIEQDSVAMEIALAVRSQRGDREAFEELVRLTSRTLFMRLYLETGDAHTAEDLAQETFLLAWKSVGTLKEAKTFRPWLFSIGHRTLLESIRRKSQKKRSDGKSASAKSARGNSSSDAMENIADRAPGPEESAGIADQRQRVLSALRSLPEEYRMPLTLRYLSGADYQTIGRELAISNGSLRGMLNRGMAMLREKLKDMKNET